MSLAYKLWKIGKILTKDDILSSIREEPEFKNGKEPVYLNINFEEKNNEIKSVNLKKDAISKKTLFFSKKIGGSGTGIYYLYPNISVTNDIPIEKIFLLQETLEKSVFSYCENNKKSAITQILNILNPSLSKSYLKYYKNKIDNENYKDDKEKKKIEKKIKKLKEIVKGIVENDLVTQLSSIIGTDFVKNKGDYWIWFSINRQSFYELMPEVLENWFKNPFINQKPQKGIDIFTNQECEIGYNPDFKVFSYDQYHDSMNHRLIDNLPLSAESAKNIKFAWMYILDNLVFYYKGMEYILIPNLLSDNDNIFKTIIDSLSNASRMAKKKRSSLSSLRKEEEKLKKKIQRNKNSEIDLKTIKIQRQIGEIEKKEKGMISEFEEQLLSIEEHFNSITIDYLFVSINRTQGSFEIKGSLEDVIPSRVSQVVKTMRENNIDDLIKIRSVDHNKTHLQDFFSRQELYFILNHSQKNNSNRILEERLYLAKLLLTDVKIKFENLLERFEFNRSFDYDHKKKILKEGIMEWVKYPGSFIEAEDRIVRFLYAIDKIQED